MSDTTFIDRHDRQIAAWLVLAPTLIGAHPVTGLINPFWGSLSGFPVHAIAATHSVSGAHPTSETLALIGGPLLVLALRIWLAASLLASRGRWRIPIIIAWALSAFAVVPFDKAPVWFPNWPIWCVCE